LHCNPGIEITGTSLKSREDKTVVLRNLNAQVTVAERLGRYS